MRTAKHPRSVRPLPTLSEFVLSRVSGWVKWLFLSCPSSEIPCKSMQINHLPWPHPFYCLISVAIAHCWSHTGPVPLHIFRATAAHTKLVNIIWFVTQIMWTHDFGDETRKIDGAVICTCVYIYTIWYTVNINIWIYIYICIYIYIYVYIYICIYIYIYVYIYICIYIYIYYKYTYAYIYTYDLYIYSRICFHRQQRHKLPSRIRAFLRFSSCTWKPVSSAADSWGSFYAVGQ